MKRFFALVVAAVLLLCACQAAEGNGQAEPAEQEQPAMKELELEANITINPVLYFLNESHTKLQAETREIEVPQYSVREDYVVQAILDGPDSEDLSAIADGLVLDEIEVMPDLINVYLDREKYIRDDELVNAKLAIAATLSDFTGKKYVNVIINGVQTTYKGAPTGVLQKENIDISEKRQAMRSNAESENPEMQAALYYLDSTESFLLPETKRLVFKEEAYVPTLVEQLISGPEDSYNHRPSIDSRLRLLDHETVAADDGKNILKLKFNREPIVYTEGFTGTDGRRMALAALTYTLVGFIPNIHGIEVQVGEAVGSGEVYTADDFRDLVGSDILLYLPNSATSTLLVGVDRIVPQEVAADPRSVLDELMKGPQDDTAYPAMLAGIGTDDVNSIYISGSTMVVDFSGGVLEKLEGISHDNAFVMIFAIVNTMTNFDGIRSVQFLVDGQRIESFGDNTISIIDPVIKNPGIVRY